MAKQPHVHKFDNPQTKKVPLHNYVFEEGKTIKDLITGVDNLKQRICKCGAAETYSLERTLK